MIRLMVVFFILLSPAVQASESFTGQDLVASFSAFDQVRKSDATTSEKTQATFEYMGSVFESGARPLSVKGCFETLAHEPSSIDPCMPIFSRESSGSGSGGVH